MELNNMDILADELCDTLERVFKDKIDDMGIYDIVDEPNHQMFKLNFAAYNYSWVQFNYENDLFEIYVFFNGEEGLLLSKENSHYSEISDWDSYLKEIMAEIELRIPDEFLKAKGWM
ncbi:hypothetical protein RN88_07705 [Streptococcus intermedius]|uniref:hypothetical protein n=1 Tax=Streptococcus intermedius TaxID=1338 RepID=UPI0006CB5323|nr:hypothetical protein [Streptococcus intermedius]ALF28372.1 hypothetical protein RN88_07705 [Streptococcus intermedius]ARC26921.1 hypothetical protein A6J72_06850 [Streptococcus intermedius]